MIVNAPPAYTTDPEMTRALTVLLAPGFQAVASPVVALSAAMKFRACPPMLVNVPPTYTLEPETAIASRLPLVALGFQLVALPIVALRAAILFLDESPMLVNDPPAYN